MSFYNVSNTLNFSTNDGNARRIAPLTQLSTLPASQIFISQPEVSGLPIGQLSVPQVLAGYLVINYGPTGAISLPRPQELLQGLRNSAVLENRPPLGAGDCINIQVLCPGGEITFYGRNRTGGLSGSSKVINQDGNWAQTILLQFTNITNGQESYIIL